MEPDFKKLDTPAGRLMLMNKIKSYGDDLGEDTEQQLMNGPIEDLWNALQISEALDGVDMGENGEIDIESYLGDED